MFPPPRTSIKQSTVSLVSLSILLMFKNIPQHRRYGSYPLFLPLPGECWQMVFLWIFLFWCPFKKCIWTPSSFWKKDTKFSRPDKLEALWQPHITPIWQMSSLLTYEACKSLRIHECHGKTKKQNWCYYLMACRSVRVLLWPNIVGSASDSTATRASSSFCMLVSSPRSVLSLISFTGLSGILIKQCSEAAY